MSEDFLATMRTIKVDGKRVIKNANHKAICLRASDKDHFIIYSELVTSVAKSKYNPDLAHASVLASGPDHYNDLLLACYGKDLMATPDERSEIIVLSDPGSDGEDDRAADKARADKAADKYKQKRREALTAGLSGPTSAMLWSSSEEEEDEEADSLLVFKPHVKEHNIPYGILAHDLKYIPFRLKGKQLRAFVYVEEDLNSVHESPAGSDFAAVLVYAVVVGQVCGEKAFASFFHQNGNKVLYYDYKEYLPKKAIKTVKAAKAGAGVFKDPAEKPARRRKGAYGGDSSD